MSDMDDDLRAFQMEWLLSDEYPPIGTRVRVTDMGDGCVVPLVPDLRLVAVHLDKFSYKSGPPHVFERARLTPIALPPKRPRYE